MGAEAAIRLPGVRPEEQNRFKSLNAEIEYQRNILARSDTSNTIKPEGENAANYAAAAQRLRKAEEDLAVLDADIGKRIPKYKELCDSKPVDIGRAQDYCGDDRVVLEYVLWDTAGYKPVKSGYSGLSDTPPAINSYCLVLTKDGVTAVPLDPDFDYNKAARDLRQWVSGPGANPSYYEQQRNELYDKLIKPVLPKIPGGVKNIVIVPDGELAYLPFDILRASNNSNDKDFGETYALSLSPSVSVSVLAQKEGLTLNAPILAFANAVYNLEDQGGDRGQRGYDGQVWQNLPGTAAEVNALQEIAREQQKEIAVYLREEVTEQAVKELSASRELQRYPIIHFACHGYFDEEEPARSGIVLSEVSDERNAEDENNGYLTVPEIAVLNFNSRIVLLSACETGLGDMKRGEGMVGLARAFLVAGAGNVGVSLWKINDTATSLFMEELYKKVLVEGKTFREAYYEVKNDFRQGKHAGYTRPAYWAAFTMYE
jgi:CHAT domain-containing protein